MKRMMTLAAAVLLSLGAGARETGRTDDGAVRRSLDQVAALILEGKPCQARQTLDTVPDQQKAEPMALQVALARAMLKPGSQDTFGLLTDILAQSRWGRDERDPIEAVLWQKL